MRVEDACAVFLIEFDPGGETEQIRGTEKYHELMDCACTILSSLFRATDLVTCVEEETFLVFICGGITEEIVLKKADSICENLRFSMGGDAPWYLTVCTGAYMASGSDFTVEELLKEAREALEKAKQERIGSYCVRTSVQGKENRETLNTSRPATSDTLAALLNFSDLGICYLEVADQITATYISPGFCRMEGTEEGTKPLPCPFENLGIHPDAQEEYRCLLKEAAGGTVITHIHRISGDGKNWRWRRVQAVRTAFFDHDLPVILEISTDVTELIKAERKLRESNERLWVAFGQTPHILWEVDLETKEFVLYGVDDDTDTGIRMRNVLTVKFPEGLIENGMIHPDSAENFRKFAQGILRGKKADCGNFIMKNQKDTNYGWVSLSYRMVWNRSGMPAKAIGVRERLPSVAGAYSTIYDRRLLPEAVRHHMITRIRVNLTDDRVEELWTEGREWPEWTREYSYSEMIRNQQIQVFPFGTGDEIIQEFQPENLLESYEQGKRWWIRNYRGIDVGGNIRWMRAVVNLQKNIRYRNLQMFLCIVDTQEQHELESSYEGNIEYDETGQLYTVETFRSLTGKLMERHSDKICAMAMIHISGGVEQMAGPGSRPGQRVQDFLGAAYLLSLGTDCLVARYSGDRLLVFFPDAGTRFDIKHRLEDAFVYVRVSTGDLPGVENLRFIAAVTAEFSEKTDFGRMLTQVSDLCNIWRNSSMDTVVFPEEHGDPGWKVAGEEGILLVQGEEGALSGKAAEQNAAFQCAAAMLEAQTLESSMRHALQVIGEYYQADRVYMMTLSEDHLEVAMIYEWMLRGKPSIRQSVLRMKVKRIPVLARCIQKKTAVFVEKPGGSDADQDQYWRFMVYPILDDGIISGFLCVENAHAYVRESGLLELMAPCLKREPEQFGRREKRNRANGTAEDILNTLPNRKDFDNMIYALNLDKRSTMGALAVDVPELSALNSTKGFSYGKKLLSYITETLDNTFGISSVYRTWDNEFVVLFPDIIQDIFTARCIRVRALMQKRYPGKIRVGYRRVSRDATVELDSRCYDAPMQFIGQKVEVRYLPDDPEKVWVFSEGKQYPMRLTDRAENGKTKRKNPVSIDYSTVLGGGEDVH